MLWNSIWQLRKSLEKLISTLKKLRESFLEVHPSGKHPGSTTVLEGLLLPPPLIWLDLSRLSLSRVQCLLNIEWISHFRQFMTNSTMFWFLDIHHFHFQWLLSKQSSTSFVLFLCRWHHSLTLMFTSHPWEFNYTHCSLPEWLSCLSPHTLMVNDHILCSASFLVIMWKGTCEVIHTSLHDVNIIQYHLCEGQTEDMCYNNTRFSVFVCMCLTFPLAIGRTMSSDRILWQMKTYMYINLE